jgi:hypothetical protein
VPVWTGAENLVATGIRSTDRRFAIPTVPNRLTLCSFVFFLILFSKRFIFKELESVRLLNSRFVFATSV